jgi:hypothetical protein
MCEKMEISPNNTTTDRDVKSVNKDTKYTRLSLVYQHQLTVSKIFPNTPLRCYHSVDRMRFSTLYRFSSKSSIRNVSSHTISHFVLARLNSALKRLALRFKSANLLRLRAPTSDLMRSCISIPPYVSAISTTSYGI